MKKVFLSLSIVFGIVLLFSVYNLNKVNDFSKLIVDLVRFEDERNITQINNIYSFPVNEYWGFKNLKKTSLDSIYLNSWGKVGFSFNYISNIIKIDELEYELETEFTYKLKRKTKASLAKSKINFSFNKNGKIIKVIHKETTYEHGVGIDNLPSNKYYPDYPAPIDKDKNQVIVILSLLFFIITFIIFLIIKNKPKTGLDQEKKEVEKKREESRLKSIKELEKEKIKEKERLKTSDELIIQEELQRIKREKRKQEEETWRKKKRLEKEKIKNEKEQARLKYLDDLRIQEEVFKTKREERLEEKKKQEKKKQDLERLDKKKEASDDFYEKNLSKFMVQFNEDDEKNEEIEHEDAIDEYLKNKIKNRSK